MQKKNDLISRSDAIDAIRIWGLIDGLSEGQAIEILADEEKVPSAQPEQRWIPVSERLPEPRIAVLGYAPKYQNIYALYYDSAYGWMIWNPIRDDCLPNSQGDIVAWMPLPECYRGEKE